MICISGIGLDREKEYDSRIFGSVTGGAGSDVKCGKLEEVSGFLMLAVQLW